VTQPTLAFPDNLITRYQKAGVIVDTNLLLLYFVGSYDAAAIPIFKRTRKYTTDDFHLLARFLSLFELVVVTPHILTEVSNLSHQLPEDILHALADVVTVKVQSLRETFRPSSELCRLPQFRTLGLADTAICDVSRSGYLVLTDDFPLSGNLRALGIDVLNFNHLRTIRWFAR